MKAARILVLGIALAAGGAAAFIVAHAGDKEPDVGPAAPARLSMAALLIPAISTDPVRFIAGTTG